MSTDTPSGRSTRNGPPDPPTQPDVRAKLLAVCRDVIAPLVRADGGELYLVGLEPDRISLHLAGTCSGCPGAQTTAASVIEPALRAVDPALRVTVTSGILLPTGATAIG